MFDCHCVPTFVIVLMYTGLLNMALFVSSVARHASRCEMGMVTDVVTADVTKGPDASLKQFKRASGRPSLVSAFILAS